MGFKENYNVIKSWSFNLTSSFVNIPLQLFIKSMKPIVEYREERNGNFNQSLLFNN